MPVDDVDPGLRWPRRAPTTTGVTRAAGTTRGARAAGASRTAGTTRATGTTRTTRARAQLDER